MTEFSRSLKITHKKETSKPNANQKCEQTSDHLFIVKQQNASTSQVISLLPAAILTPTPDLPVDAPGLFSRQCAKSNPLK